jgi:tetratricopeptide (TPR) repeat protein
LHPVFSLPPSGILDSFYSVNTYFPGLLMIVVALHLLAPTSPGQTAGELIAQAVEAQKKGNPDAAIAMYSTALTKGLDPRFEAIVLQNRALAWVEKAQWASAEQDATAALAINGKSATAFAVRAEARKGLGLVDLAVSDYAEAIKLEPGDAIYLNNRGHLYDSLQKWDLALQDFERALQLHPKYAHALAGRGEAFRNLGDPVKALVDLNQAIALDPQSPFPYNSRGQTFAALGKHEEALTDYNTAIKAVPTYAPALSNRGSTLAALGRHKEALADYAAALKIDPSFTPALNNRAMLHVSINKLPDAIEDFTEVIRLRPDQVLAYNNRAAAYDKSGEGAKALADLAAAIKLDPKNGQSYKYRAIAHVNRGRWDEALTDFREASALLPDDVETWNWLGRLLGSHPKADLRDGAKAVEAATRACELSGWKNPDCIDTLGAAYAEAGDFENAKKHANTALSLPGTPDATRQRMQRRLTLYEAGMPFHIPAAP